MGPRARFGQVRKISAPPGFDPRTVQPGSSVAILTELPGPHCILIITGKMHKNYGKIENVLEGRGRGACGGAVGQSTALQA